MLFSVFLLAQNKIFVILPSIVRGEIRMVEGNLCLYPSLQILEKLVKGYKMQVGQPILYFRYLLYIQARLTVSVFLYEGHFPEPANSKIGAFQVS